MAKDVTKYRYQVVKYMPGKEAYANSLFSRFGTSKLSILPDIADTVGKRFINVILMVSEFEIPLFEGYDESNYLLDEIEVSLVNSEMIYHGRGEKPPGFEKNQAFLLHRKKVFEEESILETRLKDETQYALWLKGTGTPHDILMNKFFIKDIVQKNDISAKCPPTLNITIQTRECVLNLFTSKTDDFQKFDEVKIQFLVSTWNFQVSQFV